MYCHRLRGHFFLFAVQCTAALVVVVVRYNTIHSSNNNNNNNYYMYLSDANKTNTTRAG